MAQTTAADEIRGMIATLEEAAADAERHENGNKAAGTRSRSAMMTVTKSCKTVRERILNEQQDRRTDPISSVSRVE
jgi:hypothetical protein